MGNYFIRQMENSVELILPLSSYLEVVKIQIFRDNKEAKGSDLGATKEVM